MQREIERVVAQSYDVGLGKLALSQLLDDVMAALRASHLQLPSIDDHGDSERALANTHALLTHGADMKTQTALIILVFAAAALIWYAHDALFLVFAGALGALILRAIAERLALRLRIPATFCVWMALAGLLLIAAAGLWFLGGAAALQLGELRDTLPAAAGKAYGQLNATPLGAWILNKSPNLSSIIPDAAHLLARATGLLSGAFGALVAMLVVLFVAITGALEPELYARGFVEVFPSQLRPRIATTLGEIGNTLRTWLIARLLTMTVTGILVTTGLAILHVPLAGALGIIAALLAFIPNIGAFLAAAPAVVLAFVAGPKIALAVVAMYVIVHILDDFIISPVVERRVVKLPPILTLVAQLLLAIAAGAFGMMLAAPLVAMSIVVVKRLWIDSLSEQTPGAA